MKLKSSLINDRMLQKKSKLFLKDLKPQNRDLLDLGGKKLFFASIRPLTLDVTSKHHKIFLRTEI